MLSPSRRARYSKLTEALHNSPTAWMPFNDVKIVNFFLKIPSLKSATLFIHPLPSVHNSTVLHRWVYVFRAVSFLKH